MKNFALIGCAGFVAPRHLEAIRSVGGHLVAAVDPHDSVGVLDRYFPETEFFTEIERFDRFLDKQRRTGSEKRIDCVSVCSPNYLHDAHVRLALRNHAHAICEKPLVISPWNLDSLAELEREYDRRVYVVLQLRLLPQVVALKRRFESGGEARAQVTLRYITPRGPWYHVSWKGDGERSGGLAMNIGFHFFDLLCWIFGSVTASRLVEHSPSTLRGELTLAHADVNWELSVDSKRIPALEQTDQRHAAHRTLTINGLPLDLSPSFSDLHARVYQEILEGKGPGIDDVRPATYAIHALGRH